MVPLLLYECGVEYGPRGKPRLKLAAQFDAGSLFYTFQDTMRTVAVHIPSVSSRSFCSSFRWCLVFLGNQFARSCL